MFVDSKFYDAKEKELIYKGMKKFVSSGFKRSLFSKRCYNVLHLYFGFIAHYNLDGFYGVRFEDDKDFTINQICSFMAYPAIREQKMDDLLLAIRDLFVDYKKQV